MSAKPAAVIGAALGKREMAKAGSVGASPGEEPGGTSAPSAAAGMPPAVPAARKGDFTEGLEGTAPDTLRAERGTINAFHACAYPGFPHLYLKHLL